MLKDFKYNILDSHLSVEGLIGPGGQFKKLPQYIEHLKKQRTEDLDKNKKLQVAQLKEL